MKKGEQPPHHHFFLDLHTSNEGGGAQIEKKPKTGYKAAYSTPFHSILTRWVRKIIFYFANNKKNRCTQWTNHHLCVIVSLSHSLPHELESAALLELLLSVSHWRHQEQGTCRFLGQKFKGIQDLSKFCAWILTDYIVLEISQIWQMLREIWRLGKIRNCWKWGTFESQGFHMVTCLSTSHLASMAYLLEV